MSGNGTLLQLYSIIFSSDEWDKGSRSERECTYKNGEELHFNDEMTIAIISVDMVKDSQQANHVMKNKGLS